MDKKVIFVINEDRFFLSHRSLIAEKARASGWDVTIVTKDTGQRGEIEKMGFKYLELPINPTGMNLFQEMRTYRYLLRLFKANKDSIVHLVGLKNMLWGGLASRAARSKGVLYAVSGLGTLFGENRSALISWSIQRLLKVAMHRKNVAVIFQNHEDEKLFKDNGITDKCFNFFIKGSGVELDKFKPVDRSSREKVRIIFTARMLREKGVEDVIAAAEILREKYYGKIEFILCGGLSENPNALTEDQINSMVDGDYIKWLGHRDDIIDQLASADIMCFPSYYREGVPKSLIEASASGLPIVTTDSVGCRDTVEHKKNGYIVSPHSPGEIAKYLRKLIENPEKREQMGHRSRKIAEKDYDVEAVASKHLEIYNLLKFFDKSKNRKV